MSVQVEQVVVEAPAISVRAVVRRRGGGHHPEAGFIPTEVDVAITFGRRIHNLGATDDWREFTGELAREAERML